jgi:hypothetical protein
LLLRLERQPPEPELLRLLDAIRDARVEAVAQLELSDVVALLVGQKAGVA